LIPKKNTRDLRGAILNVLRESDILLDVENIRVKAGLKNWESTKAILLELVLDRKIQGHRTSKGWVFQKLVL